MKQWKQTSVMIGLLLIEAIIMLYAVPKANEDEINMQMWLVIGLFFFLLISLAILIKENRGKRKSISQLFLICAATYLQIVYCSIFYNWSIVCLTLPILQVIFVYAIFKLSHDIESLMICCSNLLFSTIWANQMCGFLWYNNRSNDPETVAIASLYAVAGTLLVLVFSSIMIVKFNSKILESNETDR